MRVAFVVQRYGEEVCGGSELLCRQVAERMVKHWDVEVLTSCALDFVTWANEYPPGLQMVGDVTVRRFAVDHPRDLARMGELNDRVFGGTATRDDEIDWMRAQGPYSTAMFDFLRSGAGRYELVIFFTYLYPPTVFGIPLVPGRCAMIPTAHDEPEIYMSIFRDVFREVDALMFLTPTEQRFVNRLFGTHRIVQDVVGVGVERPTDSSAVRFLTAHAAELESRPILLYAGRIDTVKGCGTLFNYFSRFVEEMPRHPVKLVLLGAKSMDIPDHPDIIHLGFVSDQEKADAFAAARAIVQPSPYESLSMVALEAWALAKPVLVNGTCEVLHDQCVRSNGGLWYENYWEFRDELALLLRDDRLCARLGASGKEFVERDYAWNVVEAKYAAVVAQALAAAEEHGASVCTTTRPPTSQSTPRQIIARLNVMRGMSPA